MVIHRMTATFGKLQGETLELREGLNIIEAPNETGKSTWCAFLLSMLYGVNSRERDRAGYIPDKKHYAPWSGSPMSGRMDCRVNGEEISIFRDTLRKDRPMSEFRAVYAGTGESVPEIQGRSCGETLVGVSREVYERSAFIRQAGLSISRDPASRQDKGFNELEKRIAALVSYGEEDLSCNEAVKALREQWNRRRRRKIPELERQLDNVNDRIRRTEELEYQYVRSREQLRILEERAAELEAELDNARRWEAAQNRREVVEARIEAAQARAATSAMRRELEQEKIPEIETIIRLRSAIVRLREAVKPVEEAEREQEIAEGRLREARADVNESPFAGNTPAEAKELPPEWIPRPKFELWMGLALGLCGVLALALFLTKPFWMYPGMGMAAAAAIGAEVLIQRRKNGWGRVLRERRLQREEDLDHYSVLYQEMESARDEAAEKGEAARQRRDHYATAEQGVMTEVRRFAPTVQTLTEADEALRRGAQRRRELDEAERDAVNKEIRRDFLDQHPTDGTDEKNPPTPPERPKEEIEAELAALPIPDARTKRDKLWGQLDATGDPAALQSAAGLLKEEIGQQEQEAGAAELAMECLNRANDELHTRYAPALGRRTSAIFHSLTEGKYDRVTLDRDLQLFVEQGEFSREAGLFSAGCVDQLYLAARLAICEMVLPAENAAPIVLDDALTNFDDSRCGAALRYLKEAAKDRQILLFTCHSRESALAGYYAAAGEISIQRLGGEDDSGA